MSNIPSGIKSFNIPAQGWQEHDVNYYYTITSTSSTGESLPSKDFWVVTSGQLTNPTSLLASGIVVALPSGLFPSGTYAYSVSSWDGQGRGQGESTASYIEQIDLDPSGTIVRIDLGITNPAFSGVNTIEFYRSARDPVFHLSSGLVHLMPYQGTMYTDSSDTWALYHLTHTSGVNITDSSSYNRPAVISGVWGWPTTNLLPASGLNSVFLRGVRTTVFVSCQNQSRFQKFDNESFDFLSKWGGPGPNPSEFGAYATQTFRSAIDNEGNVYITDGGNSRVQKFDRNGKF